MNLKIGKHKETQTNIVFKKIYVIKKNICYNENILINNLIIFKIWLFFLIKPLFIGRGSKMCQKKYEKMINYIVNKYSKDIKDDLEQELYMHLINIKKI